MQQHSISRAAEIATMQPRATPTADPSTPFALRSRRLAVLAVRYGLFIALLLWIAAMALATDHFLSTTNLLNVARQAAPIVIIGVGMTFVMATAGIDLSIGSIVALVSCFAASWLDHGLSVWAVLPLILLAGAMMGAVNGVLVQAGIPAFIVTLAALVSVRGFAFVYSDGYAIPIKDEIFVWFGRGTILGVNTPMALAILVSIAGWFMLNRTRFGLHALAIGGREEAARVMGLAVGRILIRVYTLTGALAALGGIVISARLANGSPNAGMGLELDVIAAVVLGGTSLFGGSATIAGTVVGALFINFIRNGLNLLNVDPYWVQVATGIVLLVAVLMNTVVSRRVEQWARKGAAEAA
jgi:ribose/xylose/arabinose/galactoside ABC-type transport system permease subunit